MRKRKAVAKCVLPVSFVLLSACAAASAGQEPARDINRLTRAEIQSIDVSNLHDLVQRLRPRWLDVRGSRSFSTPTRVVVFQDQTLLGGVAVLRQLSPDMAAWMEYLDGPTASNSLPGLGSTHVEGAIVIHTEPMERR